VVAFDVETGGIWAGATETLENNRIPVFVLEHSQMPDENKSLLQNGALAFPQPFNDKPVSKVRLIADWQSSSCLNSSAMADGSASADLAVVLEQALQPSLNSAADLFLVSQLSGDLPVRDALTTFATHELLVRTFLLGGRIHNRVL
jgi:hypothetical protein